MTAFDVSAQVRAWALAEAGRQAFTEEYGVDITLTTFPRPDGSPQAGYLVVVSRPSPLLGQGPLFSLAPIPTPQPTEEQIAEVITATMRDLRTLAAQMVKMPKATQNGHPK